MCMCGMLLPDDNAADCSTLGQRPLDVEDERKQAGGYQQSRAIRATGAAREGAGSAPFLLTAQWIPFEDHPIKLERYRED